MPDPLNRPLHALLRRQFGEVRPEKVGQPLVRRIELFQGRARTG